MKSIFLKIITPLFILTPIVSIISCGSNNDIQENYFAINKQGTNKNRYLSDALYNQLLNEINELHQDQNSVEFVVIANKEVYTERINLLPNNPTIEDEMKKLKYLQFNLTSISAGLGSWVGTFKHRTNPSDNWSEWSHGTSKLKNYNDYYPLYYINHKFASLGVSNYHCQANDIYEITYDHDL